ncbi:Avt7p NDAI_0B03510 [Naumovozyma dairenensis CBS 421]|uniref:Amino acid transporter transmembrane domain-containing protein n=1 Tax=Naumovozyma dairenensis (strain ATCC 10597 / BCRC 20456 / CBS 421 / NBRC 0211 / NRRL Y-12639) TaxID=1071378 RepID=G0W6H4_NAUDC|nr:hypothetical protein NDAI_0B03510 [Naumovozyma dairenensis CBS 421]CCD23385.1 hypothetical protein NDAI_0B03510 [Naumovozyma dairenensis CBS 421]
MPATATVSSSIINLVKTIVGAGLLAIPYAFRSDGILVGTLLTLLAAINSGFGLFILAKCSKTLINPRNSSFFSICMLTYPSLSPLFDLAMIIQCFGVGLSYLVLIGDIFPGLFGGHRDYWIISSAFIIVPLSCLKKLDSLKYSSIVGLFALAYLSMFIFVMFLHNTVFKLPNEGDSTRGEVYWFHVYDFRGLLSTFSIIIFAYTGAMNLFSMIRELEDISMQNIKNVINGSIIISTGLFLLVGISGYLTFGSNVEGNIILNYNPNSNWIYIGKFCLGTMLILSFPLLFHPLRIAVNNLVVWMKMTVDGDLGNNGKNCNVNPSLLNNNNNNNNNGVTMPITLNVSDDIADEVEDESILQNITTTTPTPRGSIEQLPDNVSVKTVLEEQEEEEAAFPDTRFYGITAFLLIVMYIIALNVKSFALVLALIGATGSTSISFILPGLFGYKLIGTDSLAIGQMVPLRDRLYKRLSLLLVFFGLAVMILSLYVTLSEVSETM